MEELYSFISNVGFPIAVAAYLLIRIETKIDKLTSAVQSMAEATKIAGMAAQTAATAAALAMQAKT